MDRFRTMQSFAEVIRLGSFSEAAKTLGLSRALISRHVSDLEKHLGVPLMTRTTRRVTPTEFGAKHFGFCQRVIKEIEQSEATLKRQQKEPEGPLKIIAPKSFTTLALGDAIAGFAANYRYLNISLMLDDLSFRSYDFIERGFDVAVHTTPIRDSNLVTRKIANLRWLLALRRTISQPTASLKRRVTWRAISVWCTSIRTRAIESGVCAPATAKFPSRCKVPLRRTACSCCARPHWNLWESEFYRFTASRKTSRAAHCVKS
jgi:DNA-binding transcriptional LysR family regulator